MRPSPHLTFYRHKRHLDPRSGIVKKIRAIRDEAVDFHVAIVDYRGGRASGRGGTRIEALVSGLMEALERYSAAFRGSELRLVGAAEEKTRVESLTAQRTCFVPSRRCFLGHPDGDTETAGFAAGDTLEDATLSGLLELVEAHALDAWTKTPCPSVDLDSFEDERIDDLLRVYAMRGIKVYAVDVTGVFGIPVVAAVAEDGADRYVGSVAHFDGPTAVISALAEMHQRYRLGQKAERLGEDRGDFVTREEMITSAEVSPELGTRRIVATADRLGLEVLRLDLTRDDVRVPVVRVMFREA